MNDANLKLLLQESARQKRATQAQPSTKLVLTDPHFPKQTDFVRSLARRKAAFTDRRSGKSNGAALMLLERGMANPKTEGLYVALTKDSAKAIMLPVFREINERHALGLEIPDNGTVIKLPNGSRIELFGADAHERLKHRILGRKLNAAAIDESASWRTDVRDLVYDIIEPALTDLDGPLAMLGTPGEVAHGLFYDITTGKEKGWDLHVWGAEDNPYVREKHLLKIARLIKDDPAVVATPFFRRNYKHEWVVDDESLVYRFHPDRGFYRSEDELPRDLHFILGIDLGYNPDPTAFIVIGYSNTSPELYVIECFKRTKMIISAVVEEIQAFQERFDFDAIVVDAGGGAKQGVEEMRQKFNVPLIAADKRDKKLFQEMVNSDLSKGLIKVPEVGAEGLISEWANLTKQWNKEHTKWEEHPKLPNHLADAFLYAWRRARHHSYQPAEARPPRPGTPEWLRAEEERMEEEAERAYRISKGLEEPEEPPELERPWENNDY